VPDADRLTADHPSVETLQGRIERAGPRRPELVVPDLDPRDAPVRLVLDGSTRHAPVVAGLDGTTAIVGAFDNARMAREREGPDRLRRWVDDRGLDVDRSVLVDVVTDDLLGVRAPGEEAVYTVRTGAADSLRDIARNLDG